MNLLKILAKRGAGEQNTTTVRHCVTCACWSTEGGDIGQCRSSAPSLGDDDKTGVWPATRSTDWCMHWQ